MSVQIPTPQYPFTALVGVPRLRMALLLAAIDPLIGGVLIQGPRGSAKTTSARALAQLLSEGCFVNLPLGASEEQLLGSLDIESALQHGQVNFRPGLLARAHQGVLYVDEVNLLPDVLVDQLLDVSAGGVNRVERDGISHQHPARFVLVGTMNPEEGRLRPQLLDRFGLFVTLDGGIDPPTREAIVRARLAFEMDPHGFVLRHDQAQRTLLERLCRARDRLESLVFEDDLHRQVSRLCFEAGVEGVRADLVMLRAARAHAALAARSRIEEQDVQAVQALVLDHRRPPAGSESVEVPPQGSHAAEQRRPPPAGATMESESTETSRGQDPEPDHDDEWGVLPPEPVAYRPWDVARPLPVKKP
ncbi:protoporphyrin IX magnesium-chelatase [Ectothiorhodospira sp. PHS-1]|uniref:ATP-binding protein n=1 Tax=Ectothiorhodospira sp. PHS-1 TaxID=519989 RepID=UPI00024A8B36|nr:AAA family ATPase [Ectothiorhodospira sp. PHS-1]EHQ52569.1 protoporphyrin IX magnesium-chelatase [Ectothiorhodospira sp. PHS-1]